MTLITDQMWDDFHAKHGKDTYPDFILIPPVILAQLMSSAENNFVGNDSESENNTSGFVRKSALVISTDRVSQVTLVRM